MAVKPEIESAVRADCASGNLNSALERTLNAYGDELFGFAIAATDSRPDAEDVYQHAAIKVYMGLRAFAWRCSVRTWCYRVLRSAIVDHERKKTPAELALADLDDHQRTWVLQTIRTTMGGRLDRARQVNRLVEMRRRLPLEEQHVVLLRVARGMAWREVALAMLGDGDHGEDQIAREASRVRQRYQRAKGRLKQMLETGGVLP